MFQKSYIPDTSGFNKNIRFRCIQKKNTSELHKNRQSRCIHPSKSINLSNPRCHIIPSEANLRANHSEIHRNSTKAGNSDVYVYLSIFNFVYFRTKGSCLTPHLVSLSEPDVSSVEIRNLTNIYANVAATDKNAPAINNFLRAFIDCFTSDKIILLKYVIKYKKNESVI